MEENVCRSDNAGHCARCGEPFGGNATAFMVPVRFDGRLYGMNTTEWTMAAVCDSCVLPGEVEETTQDATCPGYWRCFRVVCSNRCRQREVRKLKWEKKQKVCVGCGKLFRRKRADAKFCSSACRQNAYRRLRMQPVSADNGR